MIFDRLDERNGMVKSVPHFDNFTKWTILVINTYISVHNRSHVPRKGKTTYKSEWREYLISFINQIYVLVSDEL